MPRQFVIFIFCCLLAVSSSDSLGATNLSSSPAEPPLPSKGTCSSQAPAEFAEQEKWAWNERICVGEIADMSEFPSDGNNKGDCETEKADSWPIVRNVSADFLEWIVKSAGARASVGLKCALIKDPIRLDFATTDFAFGLESSVLYGKLSGNCAHFKNFVSFAGSRFNDEVQFSGATFSAGLNARNANFKSLNFFAVTITGPLDLSHTSFSDSKGKLDLGAAAISGPVLIDNSRIAALNLNLAKLKSSLSIENAKFIDSDDGFLILNGVSVAGSIVLRANQDSSYPKTDLRGATIGGNLELTGARFAGEITADGVKIGGDALLDGNAGFRKTVSMTVAQIGRGLQISARFADALMLNSAAINGPLVIRHSSFKTLDCGQATIEGYLLVETTVFADADGILNLNTATVAKAVLLKGDKDHPYSNINLVGATIGSSLQLLGAHVTGTVIADEVKIGGGVTLAKIGGGLKLAKATFSKSVRMRGADVAGPLLISANFADVFQLHSAKLSGPVQIAKSNFTTLDMAQARLGSYLVIQKTTFTDPKGTLNLDGATIAAGVLLRPDDHFSHANFIGAVVGGNLETSLNPPTQPTAFGGSFVAFGLNVRGEARLHDTTFNQDVTLEGASVSNSVHFEQSTFRGPLNARRIVIGGDLYLADTNRHECVAPTEANFSLAKVTGGFFLNRSNLNGKLDLSEAQIGGDLDLGACAQDRPQWAAGTKLSLVNAKAGAMLATFSSWKTSNGDWLDADVDGFAYESLRRAYNAIPSMAEKVENCTDSMADASVGTLKDWLLHVIRPHGFDYNAIPDVSVDTLNHWLSHLSQPSGSGYSPRTYDQLASTLRAMGRADDAKEVLYEKGERERLASTNPIFKFLGLAPKWLYGYGQRPIYLLVWAIASIAL